jgi:hypothetical protein
MTVLLMHESCHNAHGATSRHVDANA